MSEQLLSERTRIRMSEQRRESLERKHASAARCVAALDRLLEDLERAAVAAPPDRQPLEDMARKVVELRNNRLGAEHDAARELAVALAEQANADA